MELQPQGACAQAEGLLGEDRACRQTLGAAWQAVAFSVPLVNLLRHGHKMATDPARLNLVKADLNLSLRVRPDFTAKGAGKQLCAQADT